MSQLDDPKIGMSPAEAGNFLRNTPSAYQPPASGPGSISLALGPNGRGYYNLYWAVEAPDSWDWIGLYKSSADNDADYLTSQWQWAVNGTLMPGSSEKYHETGTAVGPNGYHARYLVWDPISKAYRSILRSPVFNTLVRS